MRRLLVAGAGRGHFLRIPGVEQLLESDIAGDAPDPGEGAVTAADKPDSVPALEAAQAGVLDADLDGLGAVGDEVEVAIMNQE